MNPVLQAFHAVPEPVKLPFDGLAIVGWITTLFGMLTGVAGFVAAVASAAWAVIRLYETDTVQNWLAKRRK